VIEGSVQKASDVLLNAQLIKTESGEHLRAQSYRRQVQNIFDVQGEVAQRVANVLRIKLLPEQEQRLLVPPTISVEAHDLFLSTGARFLCLLDHPLLDLARHFFVATELLAVHPAAAGE